MSFVVLTLIYLNIETQHAKLMLQENFKKKKIQAKKIKFKWMINTLCNIFAFNLGKLIWYVEIT